MTAATGSTSDFTLRDLYRTLDERKRPEDVAAMILAVAGQSADVDGMLRQVAAGGHRYSYMSGDFHRCAAKLSRQVALAAHLFAAAFAGEPEDLEAVRQYLRDVEGRIGKQYGKSDYKQDRLTKEQRHALGIDISRRQYNKRFRLAARLEDKANRTERERLKRTLTLASKSRLASQLTWEQFAADVPTACFVAYWKEETQPHLVDPAAATDGFSLDYFADSYAYVASEWCDGSGPSVIVLEKHH